MQINNPEIVLLGLLLLVLVVVAAVVALGSSGGSRREVREKLEQIKGRVSESSSALMAAKQSIRLQKKSSRLGDIIDQIIPRRDQLEVKLTQAGMSVDLTKFAMICFGIMATSFVFFLLAGFAPILALFVSFIAGFGVPYKFVQMRVKGRLEKFTKLFPEAIDMMVRGLKSGLPVNECLANAGREIPDPIGTEFQKITDAMRLGTTLEDALWDAASRLDTPDFKFFVISLAVQRETGGNLGETLGNLANILRQRQTMKLKVKALSSEAKASAWIVGLLPFIMHILTLVVNPDYATVLYVNPQAIVAAIGGLIWMSIGVFIMAKMTNFEI